ncbi:histidine triad nucleotide-binding protein [Fusobacterium perfoetens]|uniref:histidine triad nucleotide-binding protein n=1 Tax=Fusobacterium perfoetens TaxID=852 RepID=UPI0015A05454|nr:histidine triad nucleotide-binding protein [Fusobacterium perfoetens]MCF2625777.1 histidine triad nucleotide-binding protein [Fusobacterium perfoetens]
MASIFTKIINREIPAAIVFENDKVIAFKDINPQAPVHILVVPKKEIATVNDIKEEDKELIGEVYLAIGKIAADLGIAEEGYRVIANCNEYGGQEVFHIHFHLLGGKKLGPLV